MRNNLHRILAACLESQTHNTLNMSDTSFQLISCIGNSNVCLPNIEGIRIFADLHYPAGYKYSSSGNILNTPPKSHSISVTGQFHLSKGFPTCGSYAVGSIAKYKSARANTHCRYMTVTVNIRRIVCGSFIQGFSDSGGPLVSQRNCDFPHSHASPRVRSISQIRC